MNGRSEELRVFAGMYGYRPVRKPRSVQTPLTVVVLTGRTVVNHGHHVAAPHGCTHRDPQPLGGQSSDVRKPTARSLTALSIGTLL